MIHHIHSPERLMMAGIGAASLIPWLPPRDLRHRRSPSTFFGRRPPPSHAPPHPRQFSLLPTKYRRSGGGHSPELSPDGENPSFDQAVLLFNGGDYHQCHDFLEELWHMAEEPVRTLLHGMLQCAVGFHHLFNQNHRGAMMELGEGLCKLRKMGFESGPFFRFEQEVSAALEFIYQTQKELAACSDDLCLTMDGSDRSYQLLGSFAAGQRLYNLEIDQDGTTCIIFGRGQHYFSNKPLRVKLPTLDATEEHLKTCEYRC